MSRDALIAHLREHAIQEGDFVLKSGRRSTWFCDAKQTACRPEGILLIAEAALEAIPADATAIGGLTAGADPVAFGIAALAATRGRALRSFSIRKETKDHGIEGRLAGALEPGTSPLEAARVVRELGAEPVMILAVVDRGGTCGAAAEAQGMAFVPLVTASDLGFDYEGP